MSVQSDSDADHHRDAGIHKSLDDSPTHVVPLEFDDPVLGERHSPRLPIPYKHFHLSFHAAEFLQHLMLKIPVYHPQDRQLSLTHPSTPLAFHLPKLFGVVTFLLALSCA